MLSAYESKMKQNIINGTKCMQKGKKNMQHKRSDHLKLLLTTIRNHQQQITKHRIRTGGWSSEYLEFP